MSTQPVPTFPMVAGFEKYYGLTPIELVDKYLEDEPDLKTIDKSFDELSDTRFKSDNQEAVFYCQGIPYLKDFFIEIVKMRKDRDTYTMYQRFSMTDILYLIYEKTRPK